LADAQHLPQGRQQAGDRHLNFHETRDNLPGSCVELRGTLTGRGRIVADALTTTPAGWHPDPTGRHEHRYWDGTKWTDHVGDAGVSATDALEHRPTDARSETTAISRPADSDSSGTAAEHTRAASQPQVPAGVLERITTFNAKRIAAELQVENTRLKGSLTDLGALDAPARKQRIEEQRAVEAQLQERVAELRREITVLESQVIVMRDRLDLRGSAKSGLGTLTCGFAVVRV
jgi:cell division protein FtsB